MDLTRSYEEVVPASILDRYDWREVRNAAAVVSSTNPAAFREILEVLDAFRLVATDITVAGGSESQVPIRLNRAFRDKGWREAAYDTHIRSVLRIKPYKPAGETHATEHETESVSLGYLVDNVKDRVALDIEWNAKDGNLDRDVAAYRAFHDAAVIDCGVIITRSFASIRALSLRLGRDGFGTTTTTTIDKLEPRMTRGAGGGCPILAVAITDRTYAP